MKKKSWKRPKLTVLTKSDPGELVLVACKKIATGGDSGVAQGGGCHYSLPRADCWSNCSQVSAVGT
jgi:hypothetical protein